MIKIDIESEAIELRNKKAGGTYSIQRAYLHTTDYDGTPKRYPEEISIFPRKNDNGDVVPYKKGTYTISDSSFKVDNGFLALGFPSLSPVKIGN